MKKTIKEIGKEIFSFESVLIFCHISPDGDTLGSAGALCLALKNSGIKCDIVCDGVIPLKYSFIKVLNDVLRPEDVKTKYQCHVAVDVAAESLLGNSWGIFVSSENQYCIDHHVSNTRYAKNTFVKDHASNSMNIADLFGECNVNITEEIATCVLLGIVTDTNGFTNDNTDKDALYYASGMMKFGGNIKDINFYMFKNQSKERAKLYIEVMNKMRYYLDDKLTIICVTKEALERHGLDKSATEGFVDFPLRIEGVEVAVSLLQIKDELYKASFRSKGKVNVNAVASEFGGGGHILASGCVVSGLFEEVIEKIVRAVDINM